jgi:hypothetical protein
VLTLFAGIIWRRPRKARWRDVGFLLAVGEVRDSFRLQSRPGTPLVVFLTPQNEEPLHMTLLTSNLFFDRKLRIAILTLATFAALC